MSNDQSARIAVIGVGRIGRQHAQAVQRSPRLRLAAVVDPVSQAREAFARDGVLALSEVGEMLEQASVDAAIVAVPSGHHRTTVTALLEAGLPVLCEKPCGLTSAEVRELAALADDRGVPLQVGYWRRFVPSLRALRDRIAGGELGEVSMLIAAQWDGEPPSAAFRDPGLSGGILVDMGVHEFDMIRWLTGQELEALDGRASTVTWDAPVPGDPETVNLVVSLSGGTTAVVSLARRYPPGDLCRVEVLGGQDAVALPFIDPASADAMMLDALQAQAEALGALALGGPREGASVEDAVAALEAAERGRAVLDASSAERVEVTR